MIIVRFKPEALKRVQILAPTTCFEWFFKFLHDKLTHKFKFYRTIKRFIFLRPFCDHLTYHRQRLGSIIILATYYSLIVISFKVDCKSNTFEKSFRMWLGIGITNNAITRQLLNAVLVN